MTRRPTRARFDPLAAPCRRARLVPSSARVRDRLRARDGGRLPRSWGLALGSILLLAAGSASAQLALPVTESAASFPDLQTELVYTIDLGTLPNRPVLVAEAIPGGLHPDLELEIEIDNFVGNFSGPGGGCPGPDVSDPAVGATRLEYSFIQCDPQPGAFVGRTFDVTVRVVDFGSSGAPAEVVIAIRGETRVPTNTLKYEVASDLSPRTIALRPDKDTTIYASDTAGSNGAGAYLWAGTEVTLIGTGPFFLYDRDPLRSLLAFDLVDAMPFNAQITYAELKLYVTSTLAGGGSVGLYRTGASASGLSWAAGGVDSPGSEFIPSSSNSSAATWLHRTTASNPWTTPGGDIVGLSLATVSGTSTGYKTFSGPLVEGAIQNMVDTGVDEDGFLLLGPGSGPLDFADKGVQFASNQYGLTSRRPLLTIDYTPAEPWSEGTLFTSVVSFIGEGEDFRWIYDLDEDGRLETDIGGICEAVPFNPSNPTFVPYTYAYQGQPGYVGVDCCIWQVDAPETGTIGTGQALFFHNLDAGNPDNLPPDTDGDGIRDNCDNCVLMPNGPALGVCLAPNGQTGNPCRSDPECAAGERCSLGQEDSDFDSFGDACPAPEPAFGSAALLASAMLAGLARGRRAATRGRVRYYYAACRRPSV